MNDDPVCMETPAAKTTPRRDVSDLIQFQHPAVIVNADDWGRDVKTTATAFDCLMRGAVSSVSAMVFMQDSERAADLSKQHGIDAGLHLNLTTPFSSRQCPDRMRSQLEKVAGFLRSHRLAQALFHPGLVASFDYLVRMQLEEFELIYGVQPKRVDGHHHMHLSENVLRQKLIPENIIVRRNFSFARGENGWLNRLYRRRQDRALARRYCIADFFFSLRPMDTARMANILNLGNRFDVEIVTHPFNREEYEFLMGGGLPRCLEGVGIGRGYRLRAGNPPVLKVQLLEESRKS